MIYVNQFSESFTEADRKIKQIYHIFTHRAIFSLEKKHSFNCVCTMMMDIQKYCTLCIFHHPHLQ